MTNWNLQRQEVAQRYHTLFSNAKGVTLPHEPESSRAVYHLYVVRVRDREGLQKHLSEAKIDTGIHYPVPLHMQKAYANYGYKLGDFPVTERIAAEIVSLPMFPQLNEKQQRRVVENVKEFVSKEPGNQAAVREPQTSSV